MKVIELIPPNAKRRELDFTGIDPKDEAYLAELKIVPEVENLWPMQAAYGTIKEGEVIALVPVRIGAAGLIAAFVEEIKRMKAEAANGQDSGD